MGFSATAGGGLFVAADKKYYGDISVDVYPEVGFQIDVSLVRLGLMTGLIYRKMEQWGFYYYDDYYSDPYYSNYHREYTLAFLPVQAQILIAPLSGGKDYMFSPYIGLMAGAFIPVGDNDSTLPAFSGKLGAEFVLSPIILYGDVRYTYAKDEDRDAGGVMLVVGGGLRFGTTD